jgi:hypothetical protein
MDDEQKRAVGHLLQGILRNSAYKAREEIERILARIKADPKRLEPFGFKVYSQNDEDGIIEEIFRRLGIHTGTFCEIGVENGLQCNTLYLIHRGWRGVWIEGDMGRRDFFQQKFGSLMTARRLAITMAVVTAENFHTLLTLPAHGMQEFDFLSIDIDGNDIHLLRALQLRPKVLCIEYNAKWPPNIRKAPVYDPRRMWTGSDFMGASLAAMNDSAVEKGYRLVGTNITGANAFFVRDDLAGALFPDDASPENLHNPPRYWLYFDHFDRIGHRPDFGPYEDLAG